MLRIFGNNLDILVHLSSLKSGWNPSHSCVLSFCQSVFLSFCPDLYLIIHLSSYLFYHSVFLSASQGCRTCIRDMRKWRENKKMKRKWRENEEMERNSLSTFPHFLFISSLSIHFVFQKLSRFATCQIWHFCRECHKKNSTYAL